MRHELKQQYLKDIAPLAEYVRNQEPDTLAYDVLCSDKDPLQVVLMERYRSKQKAYLEVHCSSAPFRAFQPIFQRMLDNKGQVTMSRHSYYESMVGFVTEPSYKTK